jgi:hypothetical protein
LVISRPEVHRTKNLANMTGFCLCPLEFQWTQKSGQSNHFLHVSGLSGLSLDVAWTSSGIQSFPTDSDGILTDCPLGVSEMAGSDESPTESVGQTVGV